MTHRGMGYDAQVHPTAHRRPGDRLLEPGAGEQSVSTRLLHAAGRLLDQDPSDSNQDSPRPLRADQLPVFRSFSDYLLDVATRPATSAPSDSDVPRCRIVLPPRTGKTVIAGHIVDRTGLRSVFVVPTRALVEQTIRELHTQLPGVPVGAWYGDEKRLVDRGVNVTTYASLHLTVSQKAVPAPIRRSALAFVDEAHHAMTPRRVEALDEALDPSAVRVALTATPDYDSDRRLCRFYPDLIHEVELAEALRLGLLAPVRVWVAEVDADGSRVRLVAGDYEREALGSLMASAPFFRAVEIFRYRQEHNPLPCLIACSSRQQAHDLWRYLQRHRPEGSPAPGRGRAPGRGGSRSPAPRTGAPPHPGPSPSRGASGPTSLPARSAPSPLGVGAGPAAAGPPGRGPALASPAPAGVGRARQDAGPGPPATPGPPRRRRPCPPADPARPRRRAPSPRPPPAARRPRGRSPARGCGPRPGTASSRTAVPA